MLKKWMKHIYNDEMGIRERLFRTILALACVASTLALVANLIMGMSLVVVMPVAGIALVTFVGLVVNIRYRKMEVAAWVMWFIIAGFLFPQMYFVGGGLDSGAPLWLVLGLLYVWMLFSGKGLVFVNTVTVLIYAAIYYVSYKNPEMVRPMSRKVDVYVDSFVAMMVVGTCTGILIKFQTKLFNKERQRTEEQKAEIERISQSKSTFFANMSHEIRTPINTIIGLNEMILREPDISDEIAENAVNIQNASKLLLSLINDILDLSKLESGKMEIVPEQYETGAMLSELVNIIWVRAHEKRLEFKLDIAPEIPSMLVGDEVRIKQILINILNNAVKYTEKGSITLSVKGERIAENLFRLHISVQDTGVGIKKEHIEGLFDAFQRVETEQNRKIEGTGLGLSISKQLIDLMGGSIAVDSIYKKGSTFTITLDQQIVDASPVGSMNIILKRKMLNRTRYKQSFEAPEARVLVVDDNELNRLVACKLLRDTKVQVDTASSGKECLALTKKKSYHVIFMDHIMPDMDGEEVLKRIRKQENGFCQDVPIVALTANVMSGAETVYRDKGFDGYLAKPINGMLFESMLLKYLPTELLEYSSVAGEKPEEGDTLRMVSGTRKKKIGITTDCVCDLPREWMEKLEIGNMHYYVYTQEGRFCDGKEICSDNLLKYLEDTNHAAHSESAPVEEYENFFAEALGEAEEVIHISMASKTSAGYATAMAAAKGFDHVRVFDSGHLSSGMGMVVLYAANMAEDGLSAEEICEKLEEYKERVSTSFIVSSPEQMYRGGKITKKAYCVSKMLNMHPVFYMNRNKIKMHAIMAGRLDRAYRKYIDTQLRHPKKIDKRILFITYAGCTVKQLEEIKQEVEKRVHFEKVVLQKASATTSSNCGIGTFGLLFMKKKR